MCIYKYNIFHQSLYIKSSYAASQQLEYINQCFWNLKMSNIHLQILLGYLRGVWDQNIFYL